MTIRVVLADDHTIIQDGLCAILEKDTQIEVVAVAQDGRDAIQLARRLTPDVIVMDINMPRLNGIDAAAQIMAENPSINIVILSMHANKELIYQALQTGIKGYLLKIASGKELASAIRAVHAGQRYLSDLIKDSIVDDYIEQRAAITNPIQNLSSREREVLQLIVEGRHNAEIADLLCISLSTVSTYRSRMLKKLGVKNISGLMKLALEYGLIDTL